MKTRTIDLPDDLESAFAVIKELRPHLELADFKHLVTLAHAADGYRVVVAETKGDVLGVMGYRILHDLAHGSHLSIDDLVTAKAHQGKGVGAALLKFAESEARRLGFTNLRLSGGPASYLEREGWSAVSVYDKKVPTH